MQWRVDQPRLALTAASCVCKPRPVAAGGESGFVADGTACAERAHVVTVVYGKVHDPHTADMVLQSYAGVVRPHPEFRVQLDDHSAVVTSHADLAVLVLETPVEKEVPFAALADSEVREGMPLIAAGYGHDEAVEQAVGAATIRPGKVSQTLAGTEERVSFLDREVDVHANHGGWPCFREGKNGLRLQGVSTGTRPKEGLAVSTSFYRQWVRAEIKQADGREVK